MYTDTLITVASLLAIGGAVYIATGHPVKGVATGLTTTKKTCHGGAHMNPPKVNYYHFPAPSSGKMLLNEVNYAKEHHIYFNPHTICPSVAKKIGYDGQKTADGTVIPDVSENLGLPIMI